MSCFLQTLTITLSHNNKMYFLNCDLFLLVVGVGSENASMCCSGRHRLRALCQSSTRLCIITIWDANEQCLTFLHVAFTQWAHRSFSRKSRMTQDFFWLYMLIECIKQSAVRTTALAWWHNFYWQMSEELWVQATWWTVKHGSRTPLIWRTCCILRNRNIHFSVLYLLYCAGKHYSWVRTVKCLKNDVCMKEGIKIVFLYLICHPIVKSNILHNQLNCICQNSFNKTTATKSTVKTNVSIQKIHVSLGQLSVSGHIICLFHIWYLSLQCTTMYTVSMLLIFVLIHLNCHFLLLQ